MQFQTFVVFIFQFVFYLINDPVCFFQYRPVIRIVYGNSAFLLPYQFLKIRNCGQEFGKNIGAVDRTVGVCRLNAEPIIRIE